MSLESYARRFLPVYIKTLLKQHPTILNLADLYLLGNKRDIPVFIDICAMLSSNEREVLFQLARENKRGSIVEIGCWAGGSAYFLGKGAEISNSPVYSIDPFDSDLEKQIERYGIDHSLFHMKKPSKEQVRKNLERHGLAERVSLIEGYNEEVALTWSNGYIGLLFVDGNHDRAKEDFYAWLNYLDQDSYVAFHDTNSPRLSGGRDASVAVEELIKAGNLTVVKRVDSLTIIKLLPAGIAIKPKEFPEKIPVTSS